ncbi:Ca2+-binding RTX toxin-like protein [Saccharothrix tamanrassetensis]|uniref:Ca2+-binding RTX toxin-like protein n=1 Tax=Saccharothrix tamanrassetensis TaxID=1051531 RepID=A0A841CSH5_9PSEU|nr:hypothetical protein [Saccharothrix tamanrassetensis]MBB5959813.1 Ca2+-binding RTX toxin-like protein [Saccharothrix tamanrassetensis]
MIRSRSNRVAALLAGALTTVGATLVAAGPATAAPTTTYTCKDPLSGVDFLASWTGTKDTDVIWAQPGSVLVALGGDDSVFSEIAGPASIACLGSGADTFGHSDLQQTSVGAFRVRGEDGNDTITGGTGNDVLIGGNGNDTLVGGPGQDRVDGGPGVDRCDAETEVNCEF